MKIIIIQSKTKNPQEAILIVVLRIIQIYSIASFLCFSSKNYQLIPEKCK